MLWWVLRGGVGGLLGVGAGWRIRAGGWGCDKRGSTGQSGVAEEAG
jgi:hypothetical protein